MLASLPDSRNLHHGNQATPRTGEAAAHGCVRPTQGGCLGRELEVNFSLIRKALLHLRPCFSEELQHQEMVRLEDGRTDLRSGGHSPPP